MSIQVGFFKIKKSLRSSKCVKLEQVQGIKSLEYSCKFEVSSLG